MSKPKSKRQINPVSEPKPQPGFPAVQTPPGRPIPGRNVIPRVVASLSEGFAAGGGQASRRRRTFS